MLRTLIGLSIMALLMSFGALAGGHQEDRIARQAELDAVCESARQKKLTKVRADLVEECVVKKERPDRAACERFYADYGQNTGPNRVRLFYDLPECLAADEFRRSVRNPDR